MSKIEDQRHPSYVKYPLADILIIVMCAVLCGLDTLGDLVVYAKNKKDFLKKEFGIEEIPFFWIPISCFPFCTFYETGVMAALKNCEESPRQTHE